MPKFRHLPTLSLEDVTHNFEQLESEGVGSNGTGKNGRPGPAGKEGKEGKEGAAIVNSVGIAYRKAAFKMVSGIQQRVPLDTIVKDPGSHLHVGAGEGFYTVGAPGYYHADGQFGGVSLGANEFVAIAVNGTILRYGTQSKEGSVRQAVSVILACEAGDKIELWAMQEAGKEETIAEGTGLSNYLSVMRVGEGEKGEKGEKGEAGAGSTYFADGTSLELKNEAGKETFKVKVKGITQTLLGVASVINENVKEKSLEGNRLAKETLGNEEIQTNAIDARTIAAGAVQESELGSEAVSTAKIKLLNVTAGTLAAEAVETAKIKLLNVTTGTIAAEAITLAKLAAAELLGPAKASFGLRKLGTGTLEAAAGDDSRLSDKREPTGAAGGDLEGTYPNPGIKALAVTAGKLGAEAVETAKIKLLNVTTGTLAAEAVTKAKIAAETIESAQVKLRGLTADRIKEKEIKVSELKEPKHSELEGLTTGDPHTQYPLAAGRPGGQEISGGTKLEGGQDLVLRAQSETTTGASIVVESKEGFIKIKKGAVLGVMEVSQIGGLVQLEASGSITGKLLKGKEAVTTEGAFGKGYKAPAEITVEETTTFEPGPGGLYNLTANKAVWICSFEPYAAVINAISPMVIFRNNGAFNITLRKDEEKIAGYKLKAKTILLPELPKNNERFVGMIATGTNLGVNNKVIKVNSETEVELEKITKNASETELTLTITTLATTAKRFRFQSGKDIVIEPGQLLIMIYDWASERWRDVMPDQAGEGLELSGNKLKIAKTLKVAELLTASGGLTVVGALTLPAESITEGNLLTNSVSNRSIILEAVTAGKLATNAVEEAKIKAEAVSKGKLAKAVQEELLVIAAPSAVAAYTSAKEETETKGTFVTLIVKTKPEAAKAIVKLVNSAQEQVFEWDALLAGAEKQQVVFMVKKGGKWVATLSGAAESATVSRVTMEP